jgi:hypothetical protein
MRHIYLVVSGTKAAYVTERRRAIKCARLHNASLYAMEYTYWRDTAPWDMPTFKILSKRIF